jgi:type IV secretory pathway TraG/TraD family ATPase VirD4
MLGELPSIGAALAAVGLVAVAQVGDPKRERGARWASRRDLQVLQAKRWPQAARAIWRGRGRPAAGTGRLVLGRHRGRLLYAERRHALVAFGPPQSGKSAGLAIPALLEWSGPAVASSIKTDLLSATLQRRRGW